MRLRLRPPIRWHDAISMALTFDPRTNDSDANGDALTISWVSAPSRHSGHQSIGRSDLYADSGLCRPRQLHLPANPDGKGGTATGTVR